MRHTAGISLLVGYISDERSSPRFIHGPLLFAMLFFVVYHYISAELVLINSLTHLPARK